MSKRIISGIKPTGNLTLGNYLGAMRHWAPLQDKGEALYFIADLHALNDRPNPDDLQKHTLDMAAWLLATGIKQENIFVESHVPAHGQLQTILNNYVTMGELSRMTQFKDKSSKKGAEGQVAGLFEYPVLMSADILLYDIDLVPVGDDQRQHVELTRDIANRFNNLYGEVFTLPEADIQKESARVMNLQDPARKMSKSDTDNGGAIYLLDTEDVIKNKIKRAVTDSGSSIEAEPARPAIYNLVQIFAAVTGKSNDEIVQQFNGRGYGDFKQELGAAVAKKVGELRQAFNEYRGDEAQLRDVLRMGAERANARAEVKLDEVKKAVGLI